jgi:hypothetical protein
MALAATQLNHQQGRADVPRIAFNTPWLFPIALGATAMCLLDPASGGRRRALVRDKAVRAARSSREGLAAAGRDMSNRLGGARARLRSHADERVDDETLVARVRSSLGRVVSHPRALDVSARDGRVTISGPILEREASRARRAAAKTRGVRGVDDRLDRHATAAGVPALQGGSPRPSALRAIGRPAAWSPTTRTLVIAAAAGVAVTLGVRLLAGEDSPGEAAMIEEETWVLVE